MGSGHEQVLKSHDFGKAAPLIEVNIISRVSILARIYIVAWLAACSVNCVSDTVLLLQVLVVPTFTAVVG